MINSFLLSEIQTCLYFNVSISYYFLSQEFWEHATENNRDTWQSDFKKLTLHWHTGKLELCFWPMVTWWPDAKKRVCSINKAMKDHSDLAIKLSEVASWKLPERCYFCWVMLSFRRTVVFLKSNEVTIPALMLRFHPLDLWTSLVSIHFASQQKAKAGCVGHIQPALLLLVWMQLGCYLNPTSAGHFSVISPWNGESWTGNATSHSYRIISCLFFLFFFILFK